MIKYLIASIFSLLIMDTATAQRMDPSEQKELSDKELGIYYLQKNKKQKTTGWILLGGGLAASTIGAVTIQPFRESNASGVLLAVGYVSALASVPLFISAAKNKGSAEILLRNENVPLSGTGFNHLKLTSVVFSLPIGKRY